MTDATTHHALGRPSRSRWTRRVLMPVVILAVASIVLLVSRQREAARAEEVGEVVQQICLEIDRQRGTPDQPLDPAIETILGPGLRGTIAAVLARAEVQTAPFDVEVLTADAPAPHGDGRATHRAIVRARGRVVLTLRMVHPGDPDGIRVLGYIAPEMNHPAADPTP